MITSMQSLRKAVEALKRGAADYLTKPVDGEELLLLLRTLIERQTMSQEHSRLVGENVLFYEQLRVHKRGLELLAMLDTDRIIDHFLDLLIAETAAVWAALYFYHEDDDGFAFAARRGIHDVRLERPGTTFRTAALREQFFRGRALLEDREGGQHPEGDAEGGHRFRLPLLVHAGVTGLVVVGPRRDDAPHRDYQVNIARVIAESGALALENARRYELEASRDVHDARHRHLLARLLPPGGGQGGQHRPPLRPQHVGRGRPARHLPGGEGGAQGDAGAPAAQGIRRQDPRNRPRDRRRGDARGGRVRGHRAGDRLLRGPDADQAPARRAARHGLLGRPEPRAQAPGLDGRGELPARRRAARDHPAPRARAAGAGPRERRAHPRAERALLLERLRLPPRPRGRLRPAAGRRLPDAHDGRGRPGAQHLSRGDRPPRRHPRAPLHRRPGRGVRGLLLHRFLAAGRARGPRSSASAPAAPAAGPTPRSPRSTSPTSRSRPTAFCSASPSTATTPASAGRTGPDRWRVFHSADPLLAQELVSKLQERYLLQQRLG